MKKEKPLLNVRMLPRNSRVKPRTCAYCFMRGHTMKACPRMLKVKGETN